MNSVTERQQGLDALRVQAELETAERSTTKRPTWAPAVVLDGELLALCHELEFIEADDKPVARLWAVFADPKRKGTIVREAVSGHKLSGIRCRGFEMRAGTKHNGSRMVDAMLDNEGGWRIGPKWSNRFIDGMREDVLQYEARIEKIRETYAEPLGWTDGDKARYLDNMHRAEEEIVAKLEKLQRNIPKAEARYKARVRITELATQRLAQFAGDPQIERERGAQLSGSCYICGKALTDKISVERGIGPECYGGLHLRAAE